MDDKHMVAEFLNSRSEQAFIQLYRNKTPRLYRMALRLTQDRNESEELVQQMWIIAVEKLSTFEWRSSLNTWLTSILINRYRSVRRMNEREISRETIEIPESDHQAKSERQSTAADLEKAIGSLPPGYRQIIILHDIEGYTHKEIGEIMDISEGTSKSQLFHARRTIREFFAYDISKQDPS